jgi:hypothetical protein
MGATCDMQEPGCIGEPRFVLAFPQPGYEDGAVLIDLDATMFLRGDEDKYVCCECLRKMRGQLRDIAVKA